MKTAYNIIGIVLVLAAIFCLTLAQDAALNFAYRDWHGVMLYGVSAIMEAALAWICFAKARKFGHG